MNISMVFGIWPFLLTFIVPYAQLSQIPTQRGVPIGGLVKESNSNTMASSKTLDTTIHCSFSLIPSLGSQYSFLTSTKVGTMEVLQVFNNGLTGGKIFLSSCL